jgi:EAL domain-containing protein (putative c-di-GMP-specific phosphodiesterase class I)/CRP-like cAMP-binding protein
MKFVPFKNNFPKLHLQKEQCLFKEGDKGDFAYIIEEGIIEISTLIDDKYTVLNTLQPGSLFGELALVDGRPRSASAYAKTDVLLTVVTPEQVKSRIEQADPILRLLLMVVMHYFRSETELLRSQKQENNGEKISLQTDQYQQKITQAIELIRLESDLRQGLKEKQLKLFYQPIVNLENLNIIGFEILLRWICPKRGNVPPSLFIPLAESTSLIIPIGEWLIETGIKSLGEIQKHTSQEIFMSINVAQRQIEATDLLGFLQEQTQKAGIKPSQIKIEVLERSLFAGESALAWVNRCRDYGFPLVIDDFGTGYANLAYLKQFQFDTVKVDKCFIDDIETSKRDLNICHALIELSHGLDMTVVAEGIENTNQATILRALGCNFGQGYFFSPPLSLDEAIALWS